MQCRGKESGLVSCKTHGEVSQTTNSCFDAVFCQQTMREALTANPPHTRKLTEVLTELEFGVTN